MLRRNGVERLQFAETVASTKSPPTGVHPPSDVANRKLERHWSRWPVIPGTGFKVHINIAERPGQAFNQAHFFLWVTESKYSGA